MSEIWELDELPCGHKAKYAVQYRGTDQDYDGVSEWVCKQCDKRFGRWTGRELKEGELEQRYGITPPTSEEEE